MIPIKKRRRGYEQTMDSVIVWMCTSLIHAGRLSKRKLHFVNKAPSAYMGTVGDSLTENSESLAAQGKQRITLMSLKY